MKKVIVILAVLAMAPVAMAAIEGTAHDLGQAEICIVCHTPHGGDSSVTDAPLWNHEVTTSIAFQPYVGTGSLTATDVGQPAGISKLCLSCHDGTVGLDNYGGATGGTAMLGTAPGFVGEDLRQSHPISFTYDDLLSTNDGGLFPPTSTTSNLVANIDDDMLFGAGNDQLECASCHDVHDDTNGSFLIMSNADSDLCLTCHNK